MNTGISESLAALQREVAPLKVFKKKELIELFKKYHKWFDNKRNCSTKQRREGKEAFDIIVLHNLKLVIKIAHQYKYAGMEPEDLVNEGTMGLMTAVEKFDVNNGAAFSTYSALWIKQGIRRCLSNKSRTIRIPVHNAAKIGKIKDFITAYKAENNNTDPSIEEIKENVKGISKKALNDLVNGGVLNLLSVDFQLSSDEGEIATFGEILEDKRIVAPNTNGEFLDNVHHLTELISKLKRKERVVIQRRFGLGNKKPETLEEIAGNCDVTRERIRQIQDKAMRKLRTQMGRKYGENFFIPVEFRVES